MKKLFRAAVLLAALALLAASLTACKVTVSSSLTSELESTFSEITSELQSGLSDLSSDLEEIGIRVEMGAPDVTIEYGDFDGIVAFTDEMLAGKYDGQTVRVEGICSKRMSSCAILEPDAQGTTKRGFTWQLEGDPAASTYPAEGARVILTGVVTEGEYGVRYLLVPADQVEVVE